MLACLLQNTEGGDTDSEDEADRLEEVESYLKVYDPNFKTLATSSLSTKCRDFRNKTYIVAHTEKSIKNTF